MEEGYGVYGSDEEDDVGVDGEVEDEEDSSEDEEDLMTAEELEEYQKKVIEAPYNYEAHIQLISALRLMGQIEPLRAAREKMSSLFPLPQEEWEQWIQDEQGLATSRFGQEQVIGLFERALADYQSVKLWEEYGRYVAQLPDTNPERVRQVFEEGLTRVGLHIPLAHQLWKAYRGYETSQDQPSRVRKLYHRELAVPLMDMEEVMEEYKQWESEQVDQEPDAGKEKQLQQAYERALRLLKERLPYEQSIAGSEQTSASEPDYSKIEMWKTYLQFEEAQKNPSQVQCLYERAVKSYCLVEELWFNYATYLERELKNVHDVTISVYERAVRNCPWSGSLWPAYIRALERGNRADSQVRAVFEKALQAGGGSLSAEGYLAIYEAFIDYCYRQLRGTSESSAEKGKEVAISSESSLQQQELLRSTFQRAVDFFKSYYTESGYATKLQRYWGTIEARQLENPEKGVELWEDLVKEHGKQGEIWLEYVSLIRSVASHDWKDKCRSSFKRACNCVHDWPEKVFSSWLDFEREYGSLEDWQQAYVRCSKRGVEIAKIRQKEAELYAQGQAYGDQQQQNYYVPPQAQRRRRQDGRSAMVPKQRKAVRRTNQQSNNGARGEKRKRWERKEAAEGEEQKQRQPQDETVPDEDDHKTKRDLKKPKKNVNEKATADSTKPGREVPQPATVETDGTPPSSRTIFVSGIPFSADEAAIHSALKEACGEIKEVRLVRNKEGKSKGFAFVEWATAKSAEQALTLTDFKMEGRALTFEATSGEVPRKPEKLRKTRTYNDKNTIFISNLPFSTTETELEHVFAPSGKIQAVRLIRDRKQKPKGYAYIQWEDEDSVQKSLQLDQTLLGGRRINVALSKPPEALAGSAAPALVRVTPPTALIPRAQKLRAKLSLTDKPPAPKPGEGASAAGALPAESSTAAQTAAARPTTTAAKGKSNAYFANLFKQQK